MIFLPIALLQATAAVHRLPQILPSLAHRKSLGVALAGDCLSAVAASSVAAPFITTIDQAIMQAAASGSAVPAAVRSCLATGLLRNPYLYCCSFQCRWTTTVYALTYAASNCASTICTFYERRSELPTLLGTTAINSASCVAKDAAFARRFGAKSPGPVPAASLALFFARDILTMGAAFVLPAPIAAMSGRPEVAQFLCPVLAQFFVVGPHLLALDIYNRPGRAIADRVAFLKSRASGTLAFRCLRSLPALGAGVILNNKLRDMWQAKCCPIKSD